MSKTFGLLTVVALVLGFGSPAFAQVHTGGSNFTKAGVAPEGDVLQRRGRSGEFGRNHPFVPGSEFAGQRRGGHYGQPQQRPMRVIRRPGHYGPQMGYPQQRRHNPMIVRRVITHGGAMMGGAAGGYAVGRHRGYVDRGYVEGGNVQGGQAAGGFRRRVEVTGNPAQAAATVRRVYVPTMATQPAIKSPYAVTERTESATFYAVPVDND